jgi:DNA-directed RNA polymerase subunit M/transcription elongation factor TFIIS
MNCPKCGSMNVMVQTFQENNGGKTVTKSKSVYKEKRHGCLWWMFIGWWFWIVDIFLWILFFIPRALIRIGRRKKYQGKTKTVSRTVNDINYTTICTCQTCGRQWNI